MMVPGESSPEKAGVGGPIPSLATIFNHLRRRPAVLQDSLRVLPIDAGRLDQVADERLSTCQLTQPMPSFLGAGLM